MTDPAPLSLSFPAIRSKKITAAFDGGAITSDAGVLLLAQAQDAEFYSATVRISDRFR